MPTFMLLLFVQNKLLSSPALANQISITCQAQSSQKIFYQIIDNFLIYDVSVPFI